MSDYFALYVYNEGNRCAHTLDTAVRGVNWLQNYFPNLTAEINAPSTHQSTYLETFITSGGSESKSHFVCYRTLVVITIN